MKHPVKIATIINYCTNDFRFLDLCVSAVKPFSHQIVIPVCDHFFNGAPESRLLLNLSYERYPECDFIEYQYDEERPYGIYAPVKPGDDDWIHYWHSTSRYVGAHFLKEEIDTLLFLDVDEIVDTDRFLAWLKEFPIAEYDALRFASYFYFREPRFRAKTHPLNALMIKRSAIATPEIILTVFERMGLFDNLVGIKISPIYGLDDKPLIHHYSWVRDPEELLFKVTSWGHHSEKDWTALLKQELAAPFSGKDCLYNFSYEEVTPVHNPLQSPQIKKVSSRDLFQLGVAKLL